MQNAKLINDIASVGALHLCQNEGRCAGRLRAKPLLFNFAFCILHFALLSCVRDGGSVAADVDVAGWGSGTEYTVAYDNRDSLSQRELSIFVLHERSFAATTDSLLLTVTTVTPDSLTVSEDWTFHPDRPEVEGVMFHETVSPYRSRAVLPRKGTYTFTFSHRNPSPVKGIKGIGLTIDD